MEFLKVGLVAGAALLAVPAMAQDCAEGQKLFEHQLILGGGICIPENPQRIAFTGAEGIPAMVLGVQPVNQNWFTKGFLRNYPGAFDAAAFASLVDTDYFPESNIETMLAVEPDVIVVVGSAGEGINKQAASVAPTIQLDIIGNAEEWRLEEQFVAALTGKEAEEQAMWNAFQDRIARLESDLEQKPGSFAIVRTIQPGIVSVATRVNVGSQLLLQAGWALGDNIQPAEDAEGNPTKFWFDLSEENLDQLHDVDYIVDLPVFPGQDPTMGEEFRANSQGWQRIPAIAAGRVIHPSGDGQQWVRTNVPYAHMIIDDVYRGVFDKEASEMGNSNPFAAWLPQD